MVNAAIRVEAALSSHIWKKDSHAVATHLLFCTSLHCSRLIKRNKCHCCMLMLIHFIHGMQYHPSQYASSSSSSLHPRPSQNAHSPQCVQYAPISPKYEALQLCLETMCLHSAISFWMFDGMTPRQNAVCTAISLAAQENTPVIDSWTRKCKRDTFKRACVDLAGVDRVGTYVVTPYAITCKQTHSHKHIVLVITVLTIRYHS